MLLLHLGRCSQSDALYMSMSAVSTHTQPPGESLPVHRGCAAWALARQQGHQSIDKHACTDAPWPVADCFAGLELPTAAPANTQQPAALSLHPTVAALCPRENRNTAVVGAGVELARASVPRNVTEGAMQRKGRDGRNTEGAVDEVDGMQPPVSGHRQAVTIWARRQTQHGRAVGHNCGIRRLGAARVPQQHLVIAEGGRTRRKRVGGPNKWGVPERLPMQVGPLARFPVVPGAHQRAGNHHPELSAGQFQQPHLPKRKAHKPPTLPSMPELARHASWRKASPVTLRAWPAITLTGAVGRARMSQVWMTPSLAPLNSVGADGDSSIDVTNAPGCASQLLRALVSVAPNDGISSGAWNNTTRLP
jgi:hypothetical protein